MGEGKLTPLTIPTPLNRQSRNIAHVITSKISPHKRHLVNIAPGVTSPHIAKFTTLFFFISFCVHIRYDTSCLDSPPHSLVSSSLWSSPLSSSITLSLQAQNVPFQQILPTLDFFYLPDCLHDNGTGPLMLIVLFLVSHFNFLFVPCGGLSWLPVSFFTAR